MQTTQDKISTLKKRIADITEDIVYEQEVHRAYVWASAYPLRREEGKYRADIQFLQEELEDTKQKLKLLERRVTNV